VSLGTSDPYSRLSQPPAVRPACSRGTGARKQQTGKGKHDRTGLSYGKQHSGGDSEDLERVRIDKKQTDNPRNRVILRYEPIEPRLVEMSCQRDRADGDSQCCKRASANRQQEMSLLALELKVSRSGNTTPQTGLELVIAAERLNGPWFNSIIWSRRPIRKSFDPDYSARRNRRSIGTRQ